jgi:hypothetical protein
MLAAALLCKEQAIVLPAMFLLADGLGIGASSSVRSIGWWLRRHAPVWGIVFAYLAVRTWLFGAGGEHQLAVLEKPLGPLWSLLYALQVMIAPFAELVYEPPREIWVSWPRLALVAVVVASLIAWPAGAPIPGERRSSGAGGLC